jgi:hypothetical protein
VRKRYVVAHRGQYAGRFSHDPNAAVRDGGARWLCGDQHMGCDRHNGRRVNSTRGRPFLRQCALSPLSVARQRNEDRVSELRLSSETTSRLKDPASQLAGLSFDSSPAGSLGSLSRLTGWKTLPSGWCQRMRRTRIRKADIQKLKLRRRKRRPTKSTLSNGIDQSGARVRGFRPGSYRRRALTALGRLALSVLMSLRCDLSGCSLESIATCTALFPTLLPVDKCPKPCDGACQPSRRSAARGSRQPRILHSSGVWRRTPQPLSIRRPNNPPRHHQT